MNHLRIFFPLLKNLIFWIIVFTIQAVIFLLFHFKTFTGSAAEIWVGFYKASYMNLATAAILSLPVLAATLWVWFTQKWVQQTNRILAILNLCLLVVACMLSATDLALFHAWGSKLNGQALDYLAYPADAMNTVFAASNLFPFILAILQFAIFWTGYKKLKITFQKTETGLRWFTKIPIGMAAAAMLVIAARGGVKSEVLNRNHVFHSPVSVLNYAALNSVWNFLDLVFQPSATNHRYHFFSDAESAGIMKDLMQRPCQESEKILTTPKPNVVILMLESWGADAVGCVGGETDVAPKMGELAKEGLLFENFYATGTRTEQGLLAVLSGIPARPVGSVIHHFGTFDHLPALFPELQKAGYSTSYYYGGRLSFDNVEAYLRSAGVQKITGIGEINPVRKTKWGAYDDEVLALQAKELSETKGPFFSVLSTLTSHEWFDAKVPVLFRKDPDHVNDDYRNTMHYADSCLFNYFTAVKKQPWYANTLFILVADHACNFPKHRDIHDPERFHIPLLIMGGALKPEFRGRVLQTVGSQQDLPATLLSQLNLDSRSFPLSKDLFSDCIPHFAWYAFDHGFGYLNQDAGVIYDYNSLQSIFTGKAKKADKLAAKMEAEGKAYLQHSTGMLQKKPGK